MTLYQGARAQVISIRKTGPNFQSLLGGKDKYFHLPAMLYGAAKKGRVSTIKWYKGSYPTRVIISTKNMAANSDCVVPNTLLVNPFFPEATQGLETKIGCWWLWHLALPQCHYFCTQIPVLSKVESEGIMSIWYLTFFFNKWMNEGEWVGGKVLFKSKIAFKEGKSCPAQHMCGFGLAEELQQSPKNNSQGLCWWLHNHAGASLLQTYCSAVLNAWLPSHSPRAAQIPASHLHFYPTGRRAYLFLKRYFPETTQNTSSCIYLARIRCRATCRCDKHHLATQPAATGADFTGHYNPHSSEATGGHDPRQEPHIQVAQIPASSVLI